MRLHLTGCSSASGPCCEMDCQGPAILVILKGRPTEENCVWVSIVEIASHKCHLMVLLPCYEYARPSLQSSSHCRLIFLIFVFDLIWKKCGNIAACCTSQLESIFVKGINKFNCAPSCGVHNLVLRKRSSWMIFSKFYLWPLPSPLLVQNQFGEEGELWSDWGGLWHTFHQLRQVEILQEISPENTLTSNLLPTKAKLEHSMWKKKIVWEVAKHLVRYL